MTADAPGTFDFEQALADLEALVEQLEDGNMPLEQSLQAFEKGVRLTRDCQQALDQAEQRVQLLVEENGNVLAMPFAADGNDDDGE